MTTKDLFERLADPAAAMNQLARTDFRFFLRKAAPWVIGGAPLEWNWHLDAIAHQLTRVESGDALRLLVTLPPRNLKSITISVAWVAWMLGRDPTRNFVCVSYSSELAAKLARDTLFIMQSAWYREIFPGTVISSKRSAAHDFETTAGGGRLATSIAGTLTGRGGDIIIIDDPIKPDEAQSDTTRDTVNEWYRTTLASRLNDKRTGAIVCVMQRLHQYDLAGMMLDGGGWTHLNLPAIAPENAIIDLPNGRKYYRREGEALHAARESLATLKQIKADQGSLIFEAQYQQNPVPATGNMIRANWLRYVDPANGVPDDGDIIQSWDTASKDGIHNDYSVCITARRCGSDIHVIDVFRMKLTFPELKRASIRLARQFEADAVLIEDAASGQQLYQTLQAESPSGVPVPIRQKPEGDKKTRLSGVSSMIEAGQLVLPQKATWLAEFQSELLAFPNAKFDDQVDALSQLLGWVRRRQAYDEDYVSEGAQIVDSHSGYTDNNPHGDLDDDEDPYDEDIYCGNDFDDDDDDDEFLF
jgi:predicted phage terminase large subunit-like protein